MDDSLIFHYSNIAWKDQFSVPDSTSIDTVLIKEVESFMNLKSTHIAPTLNYVNSEYDYITYILIGLLGIIAVIWHTMPDRFSMIFSLKTDKQFQRIGDTKVKVPGNIITAFFWINFIIVSGIFVLILMQSYLGDYIAGLSIMEALGYIYLGLISLLVYRIIVIYGTAIIFQTRSLMQQQIVTGRNVQFVSGIFLATVIILILYVNSGLLIYLSLGVIALLQLVRIVKIMLIGKSSTLFSVLHIILYLCTLEIVPVLVLIRLIGNLS